MTSPQKNFLDSPKNDRKRQQKKSQLRRENLPISFIEKGVVGGEVQEEGANAKAQCAPSRVINLEKPFVKKRRKKG